jgi:hypothetical protein
MFPECSLNVPAQLRCFVPPNVAGRVPLSVAVTFPSGNNNFGTCICRVGTFEYRSKLCPAPLTVAAGSEDNMQATDREFYLQLVRMLVQPGESSGGNALLQLGSG